MRQRPIFLRPSLLTVLAGWDFAILAAALGLFVWGMLWMVKHG